VNTNRNAATSPSRCPLYAILAKCGVFLAKSKKNCIFANKKAEKWKRKN